MELTETVRGSQESEKIEISADVRNIANELLRAEANTHLFNDC